MQPVCGQALDAQLAAVVSETDSNKCLTKWLGSNNARQLPQEVLDLITGRLNQTDANILSLDNVPLKIEDFRNTISKAVGNNKNTRSQREPYDSKQGLHRTPLDIANGDPKRVRKQAPNPGALHEGGTVVGRRFGPHGFGGRQSRGTAHRAEDTDRRGGGTDRCCQRQCCSIQVEDKVRESEEPMIHSNQLMAQEHSTCRSQDCAGDDHNEGKLQVMDDNTAVREPKGFEDCDLFPLEIEQARKHCVGHERGNTQENDWKAN